MSAADCLTTLLTDGAIASLAVNDQGHPAVSAVPYGVLRDPLRVFLLISDLSGHTAALRQDPRCSLMIHDSPRPEDPNHNHALTRVMIKTEAQFLTREEAATCGAEVQYREKYPIAEMLLGLRDFHFCQLTPQAGIFVRGFGQAYRVSGPNLEILEPISRT